MQKVAYQLDWFCFSDPGFCPLFEVLDKEWARPTGEAIRAKAGYNMALKLNIGRVDWHSEKTSQRRLWTFTGADLAQLDELDFGQQELVSSVCKVKFAHVARLDFAADIVGAGASPDDIEQAWMQGKVRTQARKMTPIEAKDKKGNGQGKTVNIGSRTSEAFLRVYDKGKEQGSDVDWTRVELETKGRLADLACVRMGKAGIRRAGCAAVRKFVSIPSLGWYNDLLTYNGEVDLSLSRKESDWQTWVMAVALPNIVKAARAGVPGVRDTLERVFSELDNVDTSTVH